MKIAVLSPVSWRTPPEHYGPWELFSSMLTEELVKRGLDVTLFATKNSITSAKLVGVVPGGTDDSSMYGDGELAKEAGMWLSLHIAECMARSDTFDLIHNNLNYMPLFYTPLIKTPMVTTVHSGNIEFSRSRLNLDIYKKYNKKNFYVSISNSARNPELEYAATIYHGLNPEDFEFKNKKGDYLLVFGRMDDDKGVSEAIEVAKKVNKKLILAGIISNKDYFENKVKKFIDGRNVEYIGSVKGKERLEVLGNAYALLHLVNFDEPFGLSVIEALASGTPVIANNRGSMPEIIEPGKTGFLVKSIDEAILSVEKIEGIDRSDCRKSIEDRFSVKIMVDNYLKLYEKILK